MRHTFCLIFNERFLTLSQIAPNKFNTNKMQMIRIPLKNIFRGCN